MSILQYIGRAPDGDYSVTPKRYTDARYDTVRVDAAYINEQVGLITNQLVTQSYVDSQDGLHAAKTAVDAADNGYILASTVGQANGPVPIGSDGYIPGANLGTVQTTRKPFYTGPTQTFLSGIRTVTTTNAKEYQAATMTIADPGFPYYPVCFALIRGGPLLATQSPPRSQGTPHYGQVSILASDDTKYGWCLAGSRKVYDYHLCIPFADTTIDPITRPPVVGALTLNLWLGLWGGQTYNFDATGLSFFSINYPAV